MRQVLVFTVDGKELKLRDSMLPPLCQTLNLEFLAFLVILPGVRRSGTLSV